MGDLVTEAVSGTLYYADKPVFSRVNEADSSPDERTALFADLARLNTLYMIANAGSGHIGSSFSSMDIVSWLYLNKLHNGDLYFSSKGHDAPGLYAVLSAIGVLPINSIHRLRRIDGLPGHPDVKVPGMLSNTGSLGMGISKAKGMAFAARLNGEKKRIYVMTGDGELQEGQIWESLISAANNCLDEITVIVDHNKIQSDYSVERTSSLGDLQAKFSAFGWHVQSIDGHDMTEIAAAISETELDRRPSVIIANTIKGKGVSFMEGASIDTDVERFQFHSGAPKADDYTNAAQELIESINKAAAKIGINEIEFETIERPTTPAPADTVRLFPAYSRALHAAAARNDRLVALDADLILDMGLEEFRNNYPERFVECGIAEMDMVSQAGGMALNGLLPVVHSFSSFLSTRPNEQIYNNATEDTKIIYVGGLSGALPGGPGHSHQSIREISCVGSIPNLVVLEPSHPDEVQPLFQWCVDEHDGPSFLRLVSIPYATRHSPPIDWKVELGRGYKIRDGNEVAIISSGIVGLTQAADAASILASRGISTRVINIPFLNIIDNDWLASEIEGVTLVSTVENHYRSYGQGDAVCAALAEAEALKHASFIRLGINDTPPSGTNDEVLDAVGLSAFKIATDIQSRLKKRA